MTYRAGSLLAFVLCFLAAPGLAHAQCDGETLDTDGDGLTDCIEVTLGTDAMRIDSDGDGMPDRFEVDHGFNPSGPSEAHLDADGDALTNLEEFHGNSHPLERDSPGTAWYVAPDGANSTTGGAPERPFRTIAYALSRAILAEEPRIVLADGVYRENVELRRNVTLTGRPGQRPTIIGTTIGATDAGLAHLELRTETGGVVLLSMPNIAMVVRDVYFSDTSSGGGTTGIRTTGPNGAASLIEDCDFTGLMTGVEIAGAVPILRRSVFADQRLAGIHVRDTAVLVPGVGLSSSIDPLRGFNSIIYSDEIPNPVAQPLGIISDTQERLLCENIDWNTNDFDEVRALFQGDCDWNPILAAGSAVLASSLICSVWDGADQKSLNDATMSLLGSGFAPITEGEAGVYVFPAVPEGSYTLVCAVNGYDVETMEIDVGAGETKSISIAMNAKGGSPGDDSGGTTGCPMGTAVEPGARRGQVVALATVLLVFCRRRYRTIA